MNSNSKELKAVTLKPTFRR